VPRSPLTARRGTNGSGRGRRWIRLRTRSESSWTWCRRCRGRCYAAGDIAQCDLRYPPIGLPVGFGQARRPAQLPVLTMVTGYSRWLSGILIPTPQGRGPVHWVVAHPRSGRGPADTGLGRRRSDRPQPRRQDRADRRLPGVPRCAGRQGDRAQARRTRTQSEGDRGYCGGVATGLTAILPRQRGLLRPPGSVHRASKQCEIRDP